ncbi:MAG: plasma-membrane proton-efflux P-type ATPase [Polyangiaceae bacterium]|jgi:plasma-membrane proton-efflux P-type ATPase
MATEAVKSAPPTPPKTAEETLTTLGSNRDAGLTKTDADGRLAKQGPNEVPEKPNHPILRLAKKFWGLSAWMIELIAVLSFFLHKHADVWVALSLLVANAVLGFFQEQRASTAVKALRSKLQVTARVLRDRSWQAVAARELVTGDVVRVRSGDFVPADLQLFDGALHNDQSALTGESNEVDKKTNDAVYAGSTVRDGEATGVVVATGARTYFGRTTQLVEGAHPKLHVEEVTSRIVRWLLLIVGSLSAVTLVTALIQGQRLVDVLPIALVLLMSAVPVALPVMFTVSMAVGSMELGRRGVLITHLSAIEDAANMDVLCADKTGTLTMNQLSFTGAVPQPGYTDNDVVQAGALASNGANADPIDASFLAAAKDRKLEDPAVKTVSFAPFSAKTRHTEAVVEIGGKKSRVIKGALRTVAEAAGLDAAAVATLEKRADVEAQKGVRALAVARADGDGPLRLVGLALLYDAPRPESRRLIDELRSLGIKVLMLTGDALPVAREMARILGLGAIALAPKREASQEDVRSAPPDLNGGGLAEVFPEDKFLVVKSLQAGGHVVGMTGDGVNDAPALKQAEVGIAVSGATDVAKGAASAVLTTGGLVNIVDLVKTGRATYQRVLTWIVNKVSRSILKAGFVVIAFLVTGKFVISALVMLLLVCLTDVTHIALATDRVEPSQKPETWNIGPLVRVAVVIGVLTLIEALGLLAIGWHRFGISTNAGMLQTFTFQTFLFFALTSLVSMRERRAFWRSRPSAALAASLGAAAVVGTVIGLHGVAELSPLPLAESALIFGFAAICSLGPNDLVKSFLCARALRRPRSETAPATKTQAHPALLEHPQQ